MIILSVSALKKPYIELENKNGKRFPVFYLFDGIVSCLARTSSLTNLRRLFSTKKYLK